MVANPNPARRLCEPLARELAAASILCRAIKRERFIRTSLDCTQTSFSNLYNYHDFVPYYQALYDGFSSRRMAAEGGEARCSQLGKVQDSPTVIPTNIALCIPCLRLSGLFHQPPLARMRTQSICDSSFIQFQHHCSAMLLKLPEAASSQPPTCSHHGERSRIVGLCWLRVAIELRTA